MLWDQGTWEPRLDVDQGLRDGQLKLNLHGKRLQGGWALVRLRGRKGDRGKENWLLIKERDDFVRVEKKPLVEREKTSVKSGRTMEEIARGKKVWHSNRPAKKSRFEDAEPERPRRKGKGLKLPPFVEPQLATYVEGPPPGADWVHEIKYDGYRAITSMADGKVVVRTRKGLDWTDRFRSLVPALADLPCDAALLDGEIAVADAKGHTDFGALQNTLSAGRGGFNYYLFDLLAPRRRGFAQAPAARAQGTAPKAPGQGGEARPASLFGPCGRRGRTRIRARAGAEARGHHFEAGGCAVPFRPHAILAQEQGGRRAGTRDHRLAAVRQAAPPVFVSAARGERGRQAPLCGTRRHRILRSAARRSWPRSSQKHARKTPPVPDVPPAIARRARFVEPALVAEIEFRGWTKDGLVRQGAFKGLRADKPAREIVREKPMPKAKAMKAAKNEAGTEKEDSAAGVRITHPDRVLWPDADVTKRDLVDYYLKVAKLMLPHVKGRPLALVRTPDGVKGERFFQKHASKGWPDAFKPVRIREKSGSDEYMYIEDEAGLVAAAQMSVVELHILDSLADDVEHPDRLVFDLDPDEEIPFKQVIAAANDMRKRLAKLGLKSFPMVTGGKGIHVVVPLKRGHSWDEHRDFAEALARLMAEEEPDRYIAVMSKAKRRGKIFIDYLRNQRGSTAIAPYSSRAKDSASIALPVSWPALGRLKNAQPAHVDDPAPGSDPWTGYFKVKQKLPTGKRRA